MYPWRASDRTQIGYSLAGQAIIPQHHKFARDTILIVRGLSIIERSKSFSLCTSEKVGATRGLVPKSIDGAACIEPE